MRVNVTLDILKEKMLHTGDFVLEVNGECVGGIVFEDVLALFAKDGRYNELISTPNISQLVSGVEFYLHGVA